MNNRLIHYARPWRIEPVHYSHTGVTLWTVLKRDENHVGCRRDGYRAVGSCHSLDDAFRFIREALSEAAA